MNEELLGKGAIRHVESQSDYRYVGRASAPYDWTVPYDIESKVGPIYVENQGTSYSCGGNIEYVTSAQKALSSGKYVRQSRFYPYSQVYVAGGGSDGRALAAIAVGQGISSEALCPSYNADGTPLTEEQYEHPEKITPEAKADASTSKTLYYATVPSNDIDAIANAIASEGMVLIGVDGFNNGTWLSSDPLPPPSNAESADIWSHWVAAGKVAIRNGKKCIGIINSWGEGVGESGWQWLSEDYVTGTNPNGMNVWVCWTLTPEKSAIVIPTVEQEVSKLPPSVQQEVQPVMQKSSSSIWDLAFLKSLLKFLGIN